MKLMTRQLGKKEDKRREMKSAENRQAKLKEESRAKELEGIITELREKLGRSKMEVERKDDLIRNLKNKVEQVQKEASITDSRKEQQVSKAKKES